MVVFTWLIAALRGWIKSLPCMLLKNHHSALVILSHQQESERMESDALSGSWESRGGGTRRDFVSIRTGASEAEEVLLTEFIFFLLFPL